MVLASFAHSSIQRPTKKQINAKRLQNPKGAFNAKVAMSGERVHSIAGIITKTKRQARCLQLVPETSQ